MTDTGGRRAAVWLVAVAAVAALALAGGSVTRSDARPLAGASSHATAPLLRIGMPGPLSTLDFGRGFAGSTIWVAQLGLEPLVRIGPDGTVKPWLAKTVTRPNPFTYVYTLRKGIKFWDGSELTAVDAANAINYYRYPALPIATQFTSVRNATAVGRYTVVVTLKKRDENWKYVPAVYAPIFQKKFADAHPETMGRPGVLTMGTGPWKYDSFDPTTGVELSANPKYWRGAVPIQHISIKLINDETARALALRSGQIDLSFDVSNAKAFEAASGANVQGVPGCFQTFFGMNVKKAPWNDVHVRRAVAYAINRADVVAAVGHVTANTTLIPTVQLRTIASKGQVDNLLKSLPSYSFNLTKAKAELAKSEYPQGFTQTLPSPQSGTLPVVTQVIAANLDKIGIKLQLKSISATQWLADIFGPRDAMGIEPISSGCNSPDPSFYMFRYVDSKNAKEGRLNVANYTPPKIDTLVAQGLGSTNPAKRFSAYGEILKSLATDVPYVPLFVSQAAYAMSSNFTWQNFHAFERVSGPWALDIKQK